MARPTKTDREKQEFIAEYFEEYRENPRFHSSDWEKADLDTRYRRVQDWLARKAKKGATPKAVEITSKEGLTEQQQRYNDFLEQIKRFDSRFIRMYYSDTQIEDLQRLKEDVNAFIDAAITEKNSKEIEEIKREIADNERRLDNWDAIIEEELTNLEKQRKAEQERLKELQERLKELQG